MDKENRKKIQKHRQDISKQYSDKIKNLERENKRLLEKVDSLNIKLLETEDKLISVEEWNERLKELIDMSDEELSILRLKSSSIFGESDSMVNHVLGSSAMLQSLFNFGGIL